MSELRCLIADDEQLARDLLESYLLRIPGTRVIAKCANAEQVEEVLDRTPVDLLLLDIKMPDRSGLQLLVDIKLTPKVILTTAFSNYALESYSLDVVDYLLKPIGYVRFAQAIGKVKQMLLQEFQANSFREEYIDDDLLLIKVGYDTYKVRLSEIVYIQAMREYVCYHTNRKKYMELRSLTSLEEELLPKDFIRIHRSYMVARQAVLGHHNNSLLLRSGEELPLGKTYKQAVLKELF